MLEDLEVLGQAYVDALSEVAASQASEAAAPEPGHGNKKAAEAMASELETDGSTAARRLQEAFRALLSIVLLSAQDRSLLKAAA